MPWSIRWCAFGPMRLRFNQSRQMVGVHAFFPSLRELSVIQAAPPDPFAVPAVPISQRFRFSTVPELLHRAHIRGTVTLDWPGRILCIQDGKDGLCIQTTQTTGVALGSLVDVVGFPAINLFKPTLEDASFRVIGHASASPPRPITPEDALKGNLDGQVVQVDAELIGQDSAATIATLILRAGGLLFPATLPKDALRSRSPWKEGTYPASPEFAACRWIRLAPVWAKVRCGRNAGAQSRFV